jgi:thioester reductase-like protein
MRPFYFITGGTGSLGREIVPRILVRDPSAAIMLLVRAQHDAELRDRMEELGSYLARYWPGVDRTRLRACRGDVTELHFGLAGSAYWNLTTRVSHVVHGAACIDLDQALDQARRINVGGVREVIRFAERCPGLIHLAHISTAFVAGDRQGAILERHLRCGQGFRNAYEQSKCESEEIVQAHMAELPITVFRPSIVAGDASDGHTCNFATFYRALRMIARGWIREVPADPDSRLDIVTVDYVAGAIAELTASPRRQGATYHLTAGVEQSARIGDLVAAARSCGRRGGSCSVTRASTSRPELSMFYRYLGSTQSFDDATTRSDLGAHSPLPASPEVYLPRMLAFCTGTDWGRSLPWEKRQCQPVA